MRIDNNLMDQVWSTKFLGVLINENLTWTDHIPYILAYKSTARISRPPKFLPQYEEKIQNPHISRPPFFRYNMEKNFVACIFA